MKAEFSSASPQQVRCETAITLLKLVGRNPKTVGLVASLHQSGPDVPTQYLACEQMLRQQLGHATRKPEVELRRLKGQGYTTYQGDSASNPLDSGFALSAQLQNLAPADKANVLAWLQANQASDGSFLANGVPDLYSTAVVRRGLQREIRKSPVAGVIAKQATTYLLGKETAAGNWNDDVTSTALIFGAVQPYATSNPGIASGVATYLLGKQLPNGSWANDAFVTAVAVRALSLTAKPVKNAR